MEPFYAQNRNAWQEWLEANHESETEVFLFYFKTGTGRPTIRYEESVEEALCFGWIDGVRNRIDAESYKIRFTPRKRGSMWSVANKQRVAKLQEEGRMTEAGLRMVEEAKKNGQWDNAYAMKNQQEIPEDFKSALLAKPQAWENFKNFSNSVQFVFIRRIDKIKGLALRAERINKAVALCEHNLKPNGPDGKARI